MSLIRCSTVLLPEQVARVALLRPVTSCMTGQGRHSRCRVSPLEHSCAAGRFRPSGSSACDNAEVTGARMINSLLNGSPPQVRFKTCGPLRRAKLLDAGDDGQISCPQPSPMHLLNSRCAALRKISSHFSGLLGALCYARGKFCGTSACSRLSV